MVDWIFLIGYIMLFLLTWWLYFGYLIFIFLRSTIGYVPFNDPFLKKSAPTMTVLVPCLNEEQMIQEKLKNLCSLQYARDKLKVLIVDGGSTDNTIKEVKKYSKKYPWISLYQTKTTGKINQLNEILPALTSDLVVCTDADGILDENSLLVIARHLENKNIGVVGIKTIPQSTISEETYFWEQQNRVRLAESIYHAPMYIIAVCYGFRRDLLQHFPDDVIADDIYISFLAIQKGLRTLYTDQATARELRCPSTLKALFLHKTRKTNAFLIEVKRFFWTFLHSTFRWKLIFYTKAAQITLGPLLLIALSFILFYVVFTSRTGILPFLSLLLLMFTYLFIRPAAVKGIWNKLKAFIFVHIVVVYCVITFPFYKQTSNYSKTK